MSATERLAPMLRALALSFVAASLVGCLGSAPPEGAHDAPSDAEPASPTSETTARAPMDAPVLPVGRAWTYRAGGSWMPVPPFTVVVAEASDAGYLFAGELESDLADTAVWHRVWFGPRDASLNPEGDTLLDFPLEDGKSWEIWGIPVTARNARVSTPESQEMGFVVEGEKEGRRVRYAFAPSVGFLTTFEYAVGDTVFESLTLDRVGTATSWVWLERGPAAFAGGDDPAGPLQVPEGFDAVAVSGGGMRGGRVAVTPPPTSAERAPWTHEAPGEKESWATVLLPAAEGVWSLAAAGPPDGWGWVQAVAVRWVRGEA